MKQVIVCLLFFLFVLSIDLKPVSLVDIRKDTIEITIKGEVETEGKMELPLYASIQDALDKAGVTDNADLSSLNPSNILKDKDILVVPAYSEMSSLKISINSGTLEELCTLNGIGESTANNIITYRKEHGLFQTLEELMNVKGIGQSKFDKIKDAICL